MKYANIKKVQKIKDKDSMKLRSDIADANEANHPSNKQLGRLDASKFYYHFLSHADQSLAIYEEPCLYRH